MLPGDMSGPADGAARQPHVLAAAATGAYQFIREQGCDPDRVALSAGLRLEPGLSQTAPLDLAGYCLLFEETTRQSGHAGVGLSYGRHFTPDMLGLIGFIAMASPTLGNAVENVAELFPYHQGGTMTRLVHQDDGRARLEYRIMAGGIIGRGQDAELTMGMFCNIFRHVLGQYWAPRAIWLEHRRIAAPGEYDNAFGAPVHFGMGVNAVVFDRAEMGCAMPQGNVRLLDVLRCSLTALSPAAMRQQSVPATDPLLSRIRTEIRYAMGNGVPVLSQVAETLRMPRWTLQRRLDGMGITFSALVERTRQEVAREYLARPTMPIGEIALLLGYSEISAFSRAFRKWTGVSPRLYRTARQAGGDRQTRAHAGTGQVFVPAGQEI
ncbi:AraC family transcriptional regulator [Komagataeibacter swingsii]|uniref:AraC family transcriptional regulator n=1 Tax=Komagataeibacter swingsii TaxID=215220 RepID=A0A850P322_9PROT|nr:AraC family transcriptional regulator [Komagataeibacter swingsii]NVN36122.1 AraC family transcriptional regulator [Komagataeibacter swingsii]